MRVISGSAKGARLKSPRSHTRPTTGMVRGAMFSILQSMVDEDWQAIDLYAGSGALGIEALSRGASRVDFVERDARSCDLIRDNLKKTGMLTQASVYCCSVNRALSFIDKAYDVIFLDPPYSDTSLGGVLGSLFESRLVSPASTVVVQHSTRQPLPQRYGPFAETKSRRYGDTCLSFYRQEGEN
jgi:16S rRNA (guanine966-N2)-methyltransferase